MANTYNLFPPGYGFSSDPWGLSGPGAFERFTKVNFPDYLSKQKDALVPIPGYNPDAPWWKTDPSQVPSFTPFSTDPTEFLKSYNIPGFASSEEEEGGTQETQKDPYGDVQSALDFQYKSLQQFAPFFADLRKQISEEERQSNLQSMIDTYPFVSAASAEATNRNLEASKNFLRSKTAATQQIMNAQDRTATSTQARMTDAANARAAGMYAMAAQTDAATRSWKGYRGSTYGLA